MITPKNETGESYFHYSFFKLSKSNNSIGLMDREFTAVGQEGREQNRCIFVRMYLQRKKDYPAAYLAFLPRGDSSCLFSEQCVRELDENA